MKPGFALSLSFEGITLLYRSGAGWRRVGEVQIDAPALDEALDELRDRALSLSPSGMRCKVVIPNDQIRYLTIETGDADDAARRRIARKSLEGATPYRVADLSFDIVADGPQTHIAAVALETLAEAEAFAVQHEFDPVSFVATPPDGSFGGEPFFGETTHAARILAKGERVDRDRSAIVVTGDVPSDGNGEAPQSGDKLPGFSSRRGAAQPAIDNEDFSVVPGQTDQISRLPPRPSRPAPTVTAPRPKPAETPKVAAKPGRPALATTAEPGFVSRRAAEAAALNVQLPDDVDAAELDEADRLTVFGARKPRQVRRRPRLVGLVLTVLLLFALAAVAAWAALVADEPVARLFGRADEQIPANEQDSAQDNDTVSALDTRILDMPATVVAVTRPKVDAEPAAAPAPQKSPVPQSVAANVPALQAPTPAAASTPQFGAPTDVEVTASARTNTLLSLADSTAGQQLPSVGGPADPPEPDPVADDKAVITAEAEPAKIAEPEAAPNAAGYALTGIWSTAPDSSETPGLIALDDLYIAAIDRSTLTQDAIALPTPASYHTDVSPGDVASPAEQGNTFKMDALGLVEPSPQGTLTPDGILVFEGNPPKVPPPTPRRIETAQEPEPLQPVLPKKRPRARPADLAESRERVVLGGLTLAELREKRPRARPYEPAAAEEIVAEVEVVALSPAELRLSQSRPKARPGNFAALVTRARPAPAASASVAAQQAPAPKAAAAAPAAAASTAAVTSPGKNAPAVPRSQKARPTGPTPATVAKQATIKNAINLHRVNLIGVYGAPTNRRALVRLSNGRYKKVKVGDVVDGGRVVAIGDAELRYQKGGRNITLKMPKS